MAGQGRLASVSECTELDFSAYSDVDSGVRPFSYLDAIRSISASKSGSSGWSGAGSSSSPGAWTSSDHSPFAVDLLFETETVAVDKVLCDPGLREIAAQMVQDRHIHDLAMAFDREPGVLLERWFSELDVDWVLARKDNGCLPNSSPLQWLVRRWTHALAVMAQALGAAQRYLRREWPTASGGIQDIEDALMKLSATDEPAGGLLLARFSQASISTMLGFADALASAKHDVRPGSAVEKFWALLEVYTCVSDAAETLMPTLQEESRLLLSKGMKSLVREMEDVFSRSMYKMRQAIWTMIRNVKALIASKESWDAIPENGQVHYTTQLVAEHLKLFWRYRSALNPIIVSKQLSDADCNLSCGTAMFDRAICSTDQAIAYMIQRLQCQLEAAESRSFSDPSIRYLFLANNSDFVTQPFVDSFSDFPVRIISNELNKIDSYLDSYVSVSWEPVVSCLHDQFQTILCFSKQPSLTTFMCELQRIYRAHKLRRIPNLHLRVRLRKAIIGKVIGAYEDYLADQYDVQDRYLGHGNGGDPPLPPRSSTSEMLDMLNELFEG